jgi:hypothetical protein
MAFQNEHDDDQQKEQIDSLPDIDIIKRILNGEKIYMHLLSGNIISAYIVLVCLLLIANPMLKM